MADSEHLKDLKAVWGNSCQSMWAELLALSIAESYVISNYAQIPSQRLLTDMFYVPKLDTRLGDLRRDTFLERVTAYRQSVITNRLVVLSASFEIYLSNFIDAFAKKKPKFWDPVTSDYTAAGNKFSGTVRQARGLDQKILKFGELAPSKIKSIEMNLPYLVDVYMLRNVLAHRAGLMDASAAGVLTHVKITAGERVTITTDQLLELAAPVIKIAEALDKKFRGTELRWQRKTKSKYFDGRFNVCACCSVSPMDQTGCPLSAILKVRLGVEAACRRRLDVIFS